MFMIQVETEIQTQAAFYSICRVNDKENTYIWVSVLKVRSFSPHCQVHMALFIVSVTGFHSLHHRCANVILSRQAGVFIRCFNLCPINFCDQILDGRKTVQ